MMPTIQIYHMPECPSCRSVEMIANMTGVTLNKHHVNLFTQEHLKDEYLKINPRHLIPYIIDGDLKMGESRAIAAYLVNRYMPADNSLYPKDPVKRAKIDELLWIDNEISTAGGKLLRPKFFAQVKVLDAEAEAAYRGCLKQLNDRLRSNGGKKFMLGDDITIGDVALAVTLQASECFDYDISEFKDLTAYFNRLKKAIPKYGEINNEPIERMRNRIRSKQEGA